MSWEIGHMNFSGISALVGDFSTIFQNSTEIVRSKMCEEITERKPALMNH
jgi:hypothetical protein